MTKLQPEKLWTRQFTLVTFCNFLLFLTLQMMLSTLPAYVKESFHADSFTVSLMTTSFALAAIVARLYAGNALQKGFVKSTLLIGLILAALCTAGYYWSGHLLVLLLMRCLFGFGFGMASTTFPTIASQVIPAKRLGEGMGYFGFSTTFAVCIGPLIGLTLLEKLGFGYLVLGAVISTMIIFPLAKVILLRQAQNRLLDSHFTAGDNGDETSIYRKALLPCLLNFLLSITYGGVLSFLALFGKEVNLSYVGFFFLVNALAVIAVRPYSGKVFDRKGPAAVLVPGAVLVTIGLLSLSYTTSTPSLLVSAVFYGMGFGMLQPSLQTWIIQMAPPSQRGVANGLFLNSLDLGVALGAMFLGGIAAATSMAVMYRVSALCTILFLAVYVSNHYLKIKVRDKLRI